MSAQCTSYITDVYHEFMVLHEVHELRKASSDYSKRAKEHQKY